MISKDIRIAIVEGEDTMREDLNLMMNSTHGYQVIRTYKTCMNLISCLKAVHFDVILIGSDCLEIHRIRSAYPRYISEIKKLSPQSKVIIFTHLEKEETIFNMLKAGADGYLTKNSSSVKLLESIKEVYEGGAPLSSSVAKVVVSSFHRKSSALLTPREIQVLELLSKGKTHSLIAQELFRDKETVRTHIKNIYAKLEVHSKSQAIEKGIHEKIL